MDDLLLFTPTKKVHISKLEDLLKGIIKKWTSDIPEKVSITIHA